MVNLLIFPDQHGLALRMWIILLNIGLITSILLVKWILFIHVYQKLFSELNPIYYLLQKTLYFVEVNRMIGRKMGLCQPLSEGTLSVKKTLHKSLKRFRIRYAK